MMTSQLAMHERWPRASALVREQNLTWTTPVGPRYVRRLVRDRRYRRLVRKTSDTCQTTGSQSVIIGKMVELKFNLLKISREQQLPFVISTLVSTEQSAGRPTHGPGVARTTVVGSLALT